MWRSETRGLCDAARDHDASCSSSEHDVDPNHFVDAQGTVHLLRPEVLCKVAVYAYVHNRARKCWCDLVASRATTTNGIDNFSQLEKSLLMLAASIEDYKRVACTTATATEGAEPLREHHAQEHDMQHQRLELKKQLKDLQLPWQRA